MMRDRHETEGTCIVQSTGIMHTDIYTDRHRHESHTTTRDTHTYVCWVRRLCSRHEGRRMSANALTSRAPTTAVDVEEGLTPCVLAIAAGSGALEVLCLLSWPEGLTPCAPVTEAGGSVPC